MSSLTKNDPIDRLHISGSTLDILARNGTTIIGHLCDVSRNELEAAGIASAEVDRLNDELHGNGFNEIS